MFDLLITGGLVLDGAGNPGQYLSVGVRDGRLEILRGDVSDIKATRRIDATGRVVSPGFIDVHAHSGLVILSEPERACSSSSRYWRSPGRVVRLFVCTCGYPGPGRRALSARLI